jgi:hypothetical protein
MKQFLWRLCLSCVVIVGVVGWAILFRTRANADARRSAAQPANPPPPANAAQNEVPAQAVPPSKTSYVSAAWAANASFASKFVIESPTEQLLAAQSAPGTAAPRADFVNPKVQPGKVRWHKDFATARAAAAKSHKPLLLFQMMGKLDDQFC